MLMMNHEQKNPIGVFAFDEVEFPAELDARTIILKVTRSTSIIIVRFDPTTIEVNDVVVRIIHASFFYESSSLIENSFGS